MTSGDRRYPVSLLSLFLAFFKIGFTTLGGGLAMVGILRHELVARRRWLTDAELKDTVAASATVPGALAVNMAFLIGYRMRRAAGTAVGVAGVVLPSFITILIVVSLLYRFLAVPVVKSFFRGASGGVMALIAWSLFLFARDSLKDLYLLSITAVMFALLLVFRLPPFVVVPAAFLLRYLRKP